MKYNMSIPEIIVKKCSNVGYIHLSTFVICLLWNTITNAQNLTKVDSLKHILSTELSNQKRVDVWNLLAKEYRQDTVHTANYTTKALQLAEKINYPQGIADAMYHSAQATMQKTTMPKQKKNLNKYFK